MAVAGKEEAMAAQRKPICLYVGVSGRPLRSVVRKRRDALPKEPPRS